MEISKDFKYSGDTLYIVNSESAVEFIGNQKDSFVGSMIRISEKGIFETLVEACTLNKLGFDITTDSECESEEEFLYEATPYVAIISVNEDQEDEFVETLYKNKIDVMLLGEVTKRKMLVDGDSYGTLADYVR